MLKQQAAGYYALLGLSLLFSVLALVTLLPDPGASKPNVLGYRSVCSFAPAATAVCGLLAGLTCTIRSRRVSRLAAGNRYRPPVVAAAVGLLLAAVAVWAGLRFAAAESRFGTVIAAVQVERQPLHLEGWEGTRTAFHSEGEISATVALTVSAGRIESLRLVDGRNVEPALAERLFAAVRAARSTQVEAVSGATASSRVVLRAIEEAARP